MLARASDDVYRSYFCWSKFKLKNISKNYERWGYKPPEKNVELLIKHALESIDEANTKWTYLAARIYLHNLYRKAAENRSYASSNEYGSFYELIQLLTEKGIYTKNLLKKYSSAEIEHFGKVIQPERDQLFTYPAILTLATRYLATDYDKNIYELPQERWMIIAMHLMQDESLATRTTHVEEAYWALRICI